MALTPDLAALQRPPGNREPSQNMEPERKTRSFSEQSRTPCVKTSALARRLHGHLATMQQANVREPSKVPRAPVLRRDASRAAIPRARKRVRDPANGDQQAAADPVARGSARLGACLHRRDQSGPRSTSAEACAEVDGRRTDRRRDLSRRVHGTMRQAGQPEERQGGPQPDRSAQAAPRRAAARRD